MLYVASGATFEAAPFEFGITGLVGTLEVRCDDNDGNIVFGPSAADVSELGTTGVYSAERTAPVVVSGVEQYTLLASHDGSWDPETIATIRLLVTAEADSVTAPPLPAPAGGGAQVGPCSAWVTEEEVAECHSDVGSDLTVLEDAVVAASQALYALSGKQFKGLCDRTVRPCATNTCWPGAQVLEGSGHVVIPDGLYWGGSSWRYDRGNWCGCSPVSRVLLPGYPVREITQVKIDGAVVAAGEYRLDRKRWLVRLRDGDGDQQFWPNCQYMDMPDTEVGTWSVTYQYGQEPPRLGVDAAIEIAWQVYLACYNPASCKLPRGTVATNRQGVSVQIKPFLSWAFDRANRVWNTGFPVVDLFLHVYNPNGLTQRAAIYSPDGPRHAESVG